MEIIASVKVKLSEYSRGSCVRVTIRFINPLKRRFIPLELKQTLSEIFYPSLPPSFILGEEELLYVIGREFGETETKFFDRVAECLKTKHLNRIVENEIRNYMGDYMEKHKLELIMKEINQGCKVVVTIKDEKEKVS
ncbi:MULTISPECIES: hypothetical protein [Bacillus cereus group]|uniref:Uncharacterized protein n=1 Tax=Bacillus thuringiensis TaxID=1428 RepID=A0A9X7FY33_BACTU|nr:MULTISPECIES: hypothetical protein [Bacillus cereus group]PEV64160.1 hypothetical protein CN434_25465 [Bacillus thuringiensis]PFT50814.1 hypothetical protein COK72_02065 [Bacillus thuringiensis]PFY22851.1 hypothetical protein COL44_18385 [Bacillus toyonensis]